MRDDGWELDRQIERQHTGGGRCAECGRAGGCLVLLGAVRRRVAALVGPGQRAPIPVNPEDLPVVAAPAAPGPVREASKAGGTGRAYR